MKLLLFLVVLFLLVGPASAATYYVATDGSNGDPGTIGEPWLTMTYAESQLSDGDTVYVRGGNYHEKVSINVANTTFKNYTGEHPVIDGEGTLPVNPAVNDVWTYPLSDYTKALTYLGLVDLRAYGITVDGFEIRNSTGTGIRVYGTGVNNCVIKNSSIYDIYRYNIALLSGANGVLVEDTEIYEGAKCLIVCNYDPGLCRQSGYPGDPAMVTTPYTNDHVFRRVKIHDSHNEGINLEHGSSNITIEYSEMYGGTKTNLYLVSSTDHTIRYNIIYGTNTNSIGKTANDGIGLYLNHEDQWKVEEGNPIISNHKIYGNLIANFASGVRIGGESDHSLQSVNFYNNIIVNNSEYGIIVAADVGQNSNFKNNIIWNPLGQISAVPSGLNFDYNLWSSIPDAESQGSNDPTYAIPQIAKSTGWSSLTGGELDGSEFTLNSTSPAIDNGTDLGSPYNMALASVSTWVDDISLLDQDDYGTGWEIGAFVYGTAEAGSAPNITSWENDKTSNNTLDFTINISESVNLNATANQTITTWIWYKDDVDQSHNYDNISLSWSTSGLKHVIVNATNTNGTSSSITWNVTVESTVDTSYFTYYKIITINQTMVNQSIGTGTYPLLVSTTDTDLRDHCQADGDDIVFFASDNTTLLPYEQELWNSTTGELVEHIGVTDITNVSYIVMYYNNSTIANSENAIGVWDSNFVVVQHLNETPAGTTYDSTSNNNDGTTVNMTSADQVSGQIDGSLDLDGDDHISLSSVPIGNNAAFTISTWMNGADGTIVYGEGYSGDTAWAAFLGIVADTNISCYYVKENNAWKAITLGTTQVNDGWHHVVLSQANKSSRTIYVDGVAEDTNTDTVGDMSILDTASIGVLERATFTSYFIGMIDELRISDSARSAEWTETEYNNTAYPALFISVGAEQGGEGAPDTKFEYWDGNSWEENPDDYHLWFDPFWNTSEYPDGVAQNAEQSGSQHSLKITNNGSASGTSNIKFNEGSPVEVTVYIDDDYTVAGATIITNTFQSIGPVLQPGENVTLSAWVKLENLASIWEFTTIVEVQ